MLDNKTLFHLTYGGGGSITAEIIPTPKNRHDTQVIGDALGWLSVDAPVISIDTVSGVMTAYLARDVGERFARDVLVGAGCVNVD